MKLTPLFVAENGRMNRDETFAAFAASRGLAVDHAAGSPGWMYRLAGDPVTYGQSIVSAGPADWRFAVFVYDELAANAGGT